MAVRTFVKDPDALLDYTIDWSEWLGEDIILGSTWTAQAGITVENTSNTATQTQVWLSGGTAPNSYTLTNRVTTQGGRTDDRTIAVSIRER